MVRGAGSHDDLVVGKAGYGTILIEVKATKAGPYAGFPPAEREALLAKAHKAGWEAMLVWWPYDRQGPRFIPPSSWPKAQS